jgi:hypothetical protein
MFSGNPGRNLDHIRDMLGTALFYEAQLASHQNKLGNIWLEQQLSFEYLLFTYLLLFDLF